MDGGLAAPSSAVGTGRSHFAGMLVRLAHGDAGAIGELARDSLLTSASIDRVLGDSLLAFSIGLAGTKYYQNILAGLTARVMSGRQAFLTDVFMRYMSFAVLAPAIVGVLVQPQWWPWLNAV